MAQWMWHYFYPLSNRLTAGREDILFSLLNYRRKRESITCISFFWSVIFNGSGWERRKSKIRLTSHECGDHWDRRRPGHCPPSWRPSVRAWTPGGRPVGRSSWGPPPPPSSAQCELTGSGRNIFLLKCCLRWSLILTKKKNLSSQFRISIFLGLKLAWVSRSGGSVWQVEVSQG